mgnify:CR=1 FL=1
MDKSTENKQTEKEAVSALAEISNEETKYKWDNHGHSCSNQSKYQSQKLRRETIDDLRPMRLPLILNKQLIDDHSK